MCNEGVIIFIIFNQFSHSPPSLFLPQRWRKKSSFIQHSVSGLCLEAKPDQLVTSKCQADAPAQQWQLLPHT